MTYRVTREEILAAVREALHEQPFVRGLALGGSDASGRVDRYSDLDFVAVVSDEHVEAAFEVARAALTSCSPLAHEFRLPEPTWHGHSQLFAALRDADPHHFVDLVVMKASAEDRLLERERHGEARVLFEREPGLFAPVPLDRPEHAAKLAARLATIRATFEMFQVLAVRAHARGFAAEAAYWYHTQSLRPLVELLRMRHCPDRFDFGLRYLDRDLPEEARREIERWSHPRDPEQQERFRDEIVTRYRGELEALDRGEWSVP